MAHLKFMHFKYDVRMWTGFIWLMIWNSGELLLTM